MATLINVATPGPALTSLAGSNGGGVGPLANNTTQTTAGTAYQLNSVTLGAGTWVVTGFCGVLSGTETLYLNTAAGTGANGWAVQTAYDSFVRYISAVVKLTGLTTIYLNGQNTSSAVVAHSIMIATQIA
jgi:hypothetical protein